VTDASVDLKALADRARDLFQLEDDAKAALALVDEALIDHDYDRFWRQKVRFLVFFGREDEARAILSDKLPRFHLPGFWELALSGFSISYGLVDSGYKLAYFPVRKCSSTTLHNAMALMQGGGEKGEHIHGGIDQYSLIKRSDTQGRYDDLFKFIIVRPPIDRIRSFYWGNIVKRDHLITDTNGRESFHGLSTKPTYEEFLEKFEDYRRTFVTVRNHTDALTAYAGSDPLFFDWVGGVQDTGALLELLSERTGIELPALNEMRSDVKASIVTAAEQSLMRHYQADYDAYGKWFS
jgi:hypothetical protein